MLHIPVLLPEAIDYLNVESNKNYIDATVGEGGYTAEILKRNAPNGIVIGIDLDPLAVKKLRRRFKDEIGQKRLVLKQANFRDLLQIARGTKIPEFSGVVFDLGMSRATLEESGRGFSFFRDEPLIMTYAESSEITAREVVNTFSEQELAKLIREFGQESWNKKIARRIIEYRKKKRIETARELAKIVAQAVPRKLHSSRIHPATKTFQALRIFVNKELESIKQALPQAFELIQEGGRIVVVSFHSLEDRVVKSVFREWANEKRAQILTKKPMRASVEEIKKNPSARSAKLRAIAKL